MSKLIEFPDPYRNRRQHTIWDDFHWFISPHMWTVTATDAGVTTPLDAANGVVQFFASDGTVADNDEIYVKTTNEVFKLADDKPLTIEARLKFTELNVDDANVVLVGVADAVAANTIVDDGAGLKTSFSGAAIYKVDGSNVWKCVSSVGATQTISTSGKSSISTGYQSGRIEFKPLTAALCQVTFFVDNGDGTGWDLLRDANGVPIIHTIDMTSTTEMNLFVGVKNGFTTGAGESILVDYMFGTAVR